jgi:hypothetical protein
LTIFGSIKLIPVVSDVLRVDLLVTFLPHVFLQNIPGLEGFLAINASLAERERNVNYKTTKLQHC